MLSKNFVQLLLNEFIVHLATSSNDSPWSAPCFYIYDPFANSLIFSSSNTTRHMQEALKNKKVAGSIANGSKEIEKIEGIQFEGALKEATNEQKDRYYKAYPVAKSFQAPIWAVEILNAKLTKNSLGFGYKEYFNSLKMKHQA